MRVNFLTSQVVSGIFKSHFLYISASVLLCHLLQYKIQTLIPKIRKDCTGNRLNQLTHLASNYPALFVMKTSLAE